MNGNSLSPSVKTSPERYETGFNALPGDCTHQSLLYNQSDSTEVARGTSGNYDHNADDTVSGQNSTGRAVVTILPARASRSDIR